MKPVQLPSGKIAQIVVVSRWVDRLVVLVVVALSFAAGFALDHLTTWIGWKPWS